MTPASEQIAPNDQTSERPERAKSLEIVIPALKDYDLPNNDAMARIDSLLKISHELATMVHAENLLIADAQAQKIRENQSVKERLVTQYQTELAYITENPPHPEERDEQRIADLKHLGQVLQTILDTHLYLAKMAMTATRKIMDNIREEVAQQDGQNVRYNAGGTHGGGHSAVGQRTSSVAVHKIV